MRSNASWSARFLPHFSAPLTLALMALLMCQPAGAQTYTAPPKATVDATHYVGYENYEAPGVLTPITTLSSGVNTVEYLGRGSGEPSVGSNWKTGIANFQSDLQTLFIKFDDSCPVNGATATWVNRRAPTSQVIDSDPIGFTDRDTGRVFAAELTLLGPNTVKISYSDDDGVNWTPTQSGGIASAVDHQTIGGGPFAAPLTGVNPVYKNAIYYCSQDIAAALCSRSDDGGLTYGPSVAIYSLVDCGGLHGHVKVSPKNGSVYVPNEECNTGQAAVAVSEDSGITWAVRSIQNTGHAVTATSDDPAVGIDSNGKLYALLHENGGKIATAATSIDNGKTWQNFADLSSGLGLKNVAFPAAVAGDAGRATVAFYGTTSGTGDSNAVTFIGLWHLYAASTFDGGLSWTVSDVTPALPMQRSGLLRGSGTITRNLLDFFDITIDRDGRVLIGYPNGCPGGACTQAPATAAGNAYAATATIARQSSGARMLAAKDPASSTSVPGIPFVTQRRTDEAVHLAWNASDSGNLPFTGFQVLRGSKSNAQAATPIATVAAGMASYDDYSANDASQNYFYKVVALNSKGASCANNEVPAPYLGNACTGTIIHSNDPTHPEATGANGGATAAPNMPGLLIDSIAVGEPFGAQNLMFKMKVGSLATVPAASRWRLVWAWPTAPGNQYYVGMDTDTAGAVTYTYGSISTLSAVVVGVPTETKIGNALPISNFKADGTITVFVPKSAVGNPKLGDLLGEVNGRTFTGDTPQSNTLERSTLLFDHTFVKGSTDNASPTATYKIVGNQVTAFTFADVNDVATSTPVKSQTITMNDVTDPLLVTVSNGQYSINGGAFTSAPGHIAKGDTLTLQQTSSSALSTASDMSVTVGCYKAMFRAKTAATAVNPPVNPPGVPIGVIAPAPVPTSTSSSSHGRFGGGAFGLGLLPLLLLAPRRARARRPAA